MGIWTIEYWGDNCRNESSLEDILNGLTKEQFKSITKETRLLEICGSNLRLPHSRSLGNGLFELRERKYGYRIYYMFSSIKTIVLLHIGNKDRQMLDIKIACRRLKKIGGN